MRIQSWRSSAYLPAAKQSWIWREVSAPPTHSMYFNVRAAFDDQVVYPMPSAATRNIGFILPIASFGGVERVAYNLAEQFAHAGWQVHLFVIGQTRIDVPPGFANSFATIHFLCDPAFGSWDPESLYQGTALSSVRRSPHAMHRIVAALAWLDAVINCHSGELNAAAGHLRHLGVVTAAHLHLLDRSPAGRSQGHPLITLAYEHAYDLVCCNSRQLMAWLNGAGIPAQKLVYVPNAPGHPVPMERKRAVLSARRNSTNKRLNALYVGRLDRQKGLDRLAEVVAATRNLDLPVDWRVVGSSVAGDTSLPAILRDLVEPAVFDDEQLIALFAWADVMVLLSGFEGVPLSVLEAQRFGVIVIATNVGALTEIVSSGRTGFLIDPDAALEETVSLLRLLIEAPALRAKMEEAASHVMEWPEAASALIERMSSLVEKKPELPAKTLLNRSTSPAN
jgi:glycosyltransferase involved in cell wall biosynthesis